MPSIHPGPSCLSLFRPRSAPESRKKFILAGETLARPPDMSLLGWTGRRIATKQKGVDVRKERRCQALVSAFRLSRGGEQGVGSEIACCTSCTRFLHQNLGALCPVARNPDSRAARGSKHCGTRLSKGKQKKAGRRLFPEAPIGPRTLTLGLGRQGASHVSITSRLTQGRPRLGWQPT